MSETGAHRGSTLKRPLSCQRRPSAANTVSNNDELVLAQLRQTVQPLHPKSFDFTCLRGEASRQGPRTISPLKRTGSVRDAHHRPLLSQTPFVQRWKTQHLDGSYLPVTQEPLQDDLIKTYALGEADEGEDDVKLELMDNLGASVTSNEHECMNTSHRSVINQVVESMNHQRVEESENVLIPEDTAKRDSLPSTSSSPSEGNGIPPPSSALHGTIPSKMTNDDNLASWMTEVFQSNAKQGGGVGDDGGGGGGDDGEDGDTEGYFSPRARTEARRQRLLVEVERLAELARARINQGLNGTCRDGCGASSASMQRLVVDKLKVRRSHLRQHILRKTLPDPATDQTDHKNEGEETVTTVEAQRTQRPWQAQSSTTVLCQCIEKKGPTCALSIIPNSATPSDQLASKTSRLRPASACLLPSSSSTSQPSSSRSRPLSSTLRNKLNPRDNIYNNKESSRQRAKQDGFNATPSDYDWDGVRRYELSPALCTDKASVLIGTPLRPRKPPKFHEDTSTAVTPRTGRRINYTAKEILLASSSSSSETTTTTTTIGPNVATSVDEGDQIKGKINSDDQKCTHNTHVEAGIMNPSDIIGIRMPTLLGIREIMRPGSMSTSRIIEDDTHTSNHHPRATLLRSSSPRWPPYKPTKADTTYPMLMSATPSGNPAGLGDPKKTPRYGIYGEHGILRHKIASLQRLEPVRLEEGDYLRSEYHNQQVTERGRMRRRTGHQGEAIGITDSFHPGPSQRPRTATIRAPYNASRSQIHPSTTVGKQMRRPATAGNRPTAGTSRSSTSTHFVSGHTGGVRIDDMFNGKDGPALWVEKVDSLMTMASNNDAPVKTPPDRPTKDEAVSHNIDDSSYHSSNSNNGGSDESGVGYDNPKATRSCNNANKLAVATVYPWRASQNPPSIPTQQPRQAILDHRILQQGKMGVTQDVQSSEVTGMCSPPSVAVTRRFVVTLKPKHISHRFKEEKGLAMKRHEILKHQARG